MQHNFNLLFFRNCHNGILLTITELSLIVSRSKISHIPQLIFCTHQLAGTTAHTEDEKCIKIVR